MPRRNRATEDPIRRQILDDPVVYGTIEDLITENQFEDACRRWARAAGWVEPPTQRELDKMEKYFQTLAPPAPGGSS